MNVLMTLILAFHPDFYILINRDKVEMIQLKYVMMLQRYLRLYATADVYNFILTLGTA